jgi:P pilus assembly chaperone PapD
MTKYVAFFWGLIASQNAFSIQLDKTSTFMESDENQVTIHVSNVDQKAAHLFSISTMRVDSPYTMKPIVSDEQSKNDLLYTPARIIVPAGGDVNVKFFYHGISDALERYYAISWLDNPLSEKMRTTALKSSEVTTKARVTTVLVIRPRHENFSYKFKNNKLTNTGNTTLRVVAYGPCVDAQHKSCEQRVNLTSGKNVFFKKFNATSDNFHIGLWHGKKFEPVK